MSSGNLKDRLSDNASLRLLRHPHALFVLTFLSRAFKTDQTLMIESDLLQGRLAQFLESSDLLPEEVPKPQGAPAQQARSLLDHWCRDEVRWLRRFADDEGRVWVELTAWTERAFQWLDTLEDETLVGTESRFEEITQRLDELLDRLDPDPAAAVRRLEGKKKTLDEEIRRITETGQVRLWSDLQLEERLKTLNRLSRELLGDFKQVEANFKTIVKEIYARQAQLDFSRGEILGYTMDATEALRQSPQGRSFYAFWEHLIKDSGKETLRQKVEELYARVEERQPLRDEILRNLKTHLHLAGRKVIAGNHLLSEKLNKLLTERERQRREKVLGLLRDIKDSVVQLKHPPQEEIFCEIEGPCDLSMVMDRPLSEPPRAKALSRPSRRIEEVTQEDLDVLGHQFSVDTSRLRQRLEAQLKTHPRISLTELLKLYPPEKGLSEVLAYFELASLSEGASIRPDLASLLPLGTEPGRALKSPTVEFTRES